MRTLFVLLVSSTVLGCNGADSGADSTAGAESANAPELEEVQPPRRRALPDEEAERVYNRMREALDSDSGWRQTRYLEFDWVLWRGAPILTRSYRYAPWSGQFRVETQLNGNRIVALGNWDRPRLTRIWVDGEEVTGDSAVTLRRRTERMFELDVNQLILPFRWDDMRLTADYLGEDTTADGKRVEVVGLEDASSTFADAPRQVFWIEAETGLPVRTLKYDSPQDTEPARTLTWTGWEEHGPLLLSTRREVEGPSEIRFENLTVRAFLPPDRFQPPTD